MPLAAGHAALHQEPVELRALRLLSGMPSHIAQPAGRNDVSRRILAAILAGNKMLRRGFQRCQRGWPKTQVRKFGRVGQPHREVAVAAPALLGLVGEMSQSLEFGHA